MKKKMIVTGASSGIGKAIYDEFRFGREEWELIGISRRGPDVKMDLNGALFPFNELMTNEVSTVSPDVLINCIGIMPLHESNLENTIFDVNFWSIYHLMNKFLNPGICVINIASVSGIKAEEEVPIYAASKAAVISLTKSYAKKYASMSARFNCISPGFVDTPLVGGTTPQDLIDEIPMKREAVPDEIVPVVKMLIDSEYITGANIVIDGGLTC